MNLRNHITHKTMDIKPLRGKVLAELIDKGERVTKAGVILMDDDGKDEGICHRHERCVQCMLHAPNDLIACSTSQRERTKQVGGHSSSHAKD